MSLSNVIRAFTLASQTQPIGSDEFVHRVERERLAASPEERERNRLKEQAEQEKQQAYQEGLKAGHQQGLKQGQALAHQIKADLTGVIEALTSYRQTFYEQGAAQLFELAFALADKVAGSRCQREQELVLESINRCLAEILDKSRVKLKVSAAQLDFVKSCTDGIKQQNDSVIAIEVEADSRVKAGGCIVETDSGSADGRLASQLALLRSQLEKLDS